MPLHGYGLLIGKIVGSRPRQGDNPHWQLFVQPKNPGHPPYRVAVNLQTGATPAAPAAPRAKDIQYQVVNLKSVAAASTLLKELGDLGRTDNFLAADDHPGLPRLDFVRNKDVLGLTDFQNASTGGDPFAAFGAALAKLKTGVVAVFGTGYPMNQRTGVGAATGFTGIENIHMNQGSFNAVGGDEHYLENGPNQDGGIIFLSPSGATGFFVKFQTQTTNTDDDGNPAHTGIAKLDNTSRRVRNAIMPPAAPVATAVNPLAAAKPTAAAPAFIFADTNPKDADGAFIVDDDAATYKAPFTMSLSSGRTRGPVPTPRRYPTLDLSEVVGSTPPGYTKDAGGERIAFDIIGDSGAPTDKALPGELHVTDLLVRNAQASPPAFLFHVGDVVYYYGEDNYYYGQFYEPFRAYPAPIFAIPGNHDGVTYTPEMISLAAFEETFCATAPGRGSFSGGILRSTMIQPGVYFTLDAPLVSIIGLYSNCSESVGWLDEQQLLFLYQELVRLKKLRQREGRATILAIHHCPRWFPGEAKSDPTSGAIDRACVQAQFWPDAVVCGHAHLYQRIVRQDGGRDVPYIITGAGGYGLNANQVVAKQYVATLDPSLTRLLIEEGYVRATVSLPSGAASKPTLRFEYNSIKQTSDQPDDVCTVDLSTHKIL
jgi:hypothetical protein